MTFAQTKELRKKSGLIFNLKSPYQRIVLRRVRRGILLELNGSPQVHSREEQIYHESMATLPMMLAKSVKRVAILGGGDGLAARNVLLFPQAKDVTLVELDPLMIKVCRDNSHLREMNRGSLFNAKVKIELRDAIQWLKDVLGQFDVLIHDVEVEATGQPVEQTLESCVELYQEIYNKLTPGGVCAVTIAHDEGAELIEGLYEKLNESWPPNVREQFLRSRSVMGRTHVLFQTIFPFVRKWTLKLKFLGSHTTFYLSKSRLKSLRRFPVENPRWITPIRAIKILEAD